MKALVLKSEGGDQDSWYESVERVFIVPDDFTEETLAALSREWQETWEYELYRWGPRKGTAKRTKRITISFVDWLTKKFEPVTIVECLV